MDWRLALVLVTLCGLAGAQAPVFQQEPIPTFTVGTRYPNLEEDEQCRPIKLRLIRHSVRFTATLVRNTNDDMIYANEDARFMTSRLKFRLDTLAEWYFNTYSARLTVMLSYAEPTAVTDRANSLHYEGRSARVRGISNSHLPNILNQAVLFGFDWVIYANSSYCRVSVIPDVCQTNLDLLFLLDQSGSVGRRNHNLALQFIQAVVNFFEVGYNDTRVAVFTFGTGARVDILFDPSLTTQQVVSRINWIPYRGGWTHTALALDLAHVAFTYPEVNGARPIAAGVPRIVVLITDGRSNTYSITQPAIDLLATGATVYSIGIGNVYIPELNQIASDPDSDHVFVLNSYTDAASFVQLLSGTTCDTPANIPPGETPENDVEEDDFKYFQVQCGTFTSTIIIEQIDIIGHCAVYVSITIINPGPLNPTTEVFRNETINVTRRKLIITVGNGQNVFISIRGLTIINRFQMVVWSMLFSEDEYSEEVQNGASAGEVIDLDIVNASDSLYFFDITEGNSAGRFEIDDMTGVISTTQPLLATQQSYYELKVIAYLRSDDCQRGTTTVKVTVITQNVNPPVFQGITPFFIMETVPINSDVGQVNASDPDFGANGEIRYFITGGNSGDAFTIDSVTGLIRTAIRLNHTQTPSYSLTIEARDQAVNMPMTGTASQVINIEDVNQSPFFLTQCAVTDTCVFLVSEDAALGNIGQRIEVGDPDSSTLQNGQVTLALDPSTPFSISNNLGEISLISGLDRETQDSYIINLTATDGGTPALSVFTVVTIIVTDVNDNRPMLLFAPSTVTVPENTQVGVAIAQVASDDRDIGVNAEVLYNITGSSLFDIDENTGAISVVGSLDYETATNHTVNVTGTNPDGLASSPLSILIIVTNINDNTPVFEQDAYTASVTEGIDIGTFVIAVTATDDDLGLAGEVRYSIVSGNIGDAFAINNNDGMITVNSNIDREMISEYTLTVRARDRVRPRRSDTSVVTITVYDVNDNAPVFQRSQYSLVIREDVSVPSTHITLIATDADQPGNANSAIRYQIESGNVGMAFNLSEATGVLTLQNSLDFETVSSYTLVVTASDSGTVPLSSNATVSITVVNVNDEIPTLNGVQDISLSESTTTPTTIANYTAMEELGDTLEFALTGNQNGEFSINPSTGIVTLMQALDYEATQQYILTVTVSDGLLSDSLILTINVLDENDNAPVFEMFGPFVITEEEPSNTLVGVVTANDADSGINAEISYSTTSGDDIFNISTNGEIRTTAVLDREMLGSDLSFTVVATDNGIPQFMSVVSVTIQLQDINDNRPILVSPPTEVNVSESEVIQTVILMIQATDSDIGENGVISYEITGSSLFTIDNSTGTIILTGSLDYETATEHVINITAVNPDGLSSLPHSVLIRVINENDNLPVFTMNPYTASVTESSGIGTFVVNVTAIDSDFSIVRYSIVSGNVGGVFAIDTISGIITVNGSIDRETVSDYVLTVAASDLGFSRQRRQVSTSTVTSAVRIEVSDVNDNAPIIQQSPYTVTLREDAPQGMIVSLVATDADKLNTPNSMLNFSIESGNEASKFNLDNITGTLSLVQQLDFETEPMFVLTVRAQDQGDPSLRSNIAIVNITITNINDLPPVISENQVVNISELMELRTQVANFNASGEEGESLTFSLMGDSTGTFEIDAQTGIVVLARSLDHELRTIYILQVSVSDGLFSSISTLTVNVLDENDNTPQIAPLGPLSVNEEMQAGTLVANVTAFDADSGINGQLTFVISPAAINSYISIDSSTREIRTADILDREALVSNGSFVPPLSSETFNITATDGGSPIRSVEIEVVLVLRDINDNPPMFSNLPNEVNISESAAIGDEILQVITTDADLGVNAQHQFSSMDNESVFTIDSVTGIVTLSSNLDYEITQQHMVNISVTDGLHVRSGLLTVNVLDENDNSPIFTLSVYNAIVAENSLINSTIITVQASDPDSHVGEFGSVFYALQGAGNEFDIFPGSGEIVVNMVNLDRETVSLYTLTVVATDYGVPSRSSTANVVVTVTDENDNAPSFQQSVYQSNIREDAQNQSEVITVLATDADAPGNNNSVIEYSLNDTSVFTIGINSGTINLASSLNFETTPTYVLTVIARDRGYPLPLNGTATVIINVINVNDEPPMLSGNQSQSLNLSELTPVLTEIIQYTVVGESSNETITYSLNGSNSDNFAINSTTGAVTLVQSLDYETIQFYSLNVFVNDSRFVSTSQLNITVLDVNDNIPQFDTVGLLQVREQELEGTLVGQVNATDADSGVNQIVTYSFVQSSIGNLFTINVTTGEIFTAIILDREALVLQNNIFLPPASQITFQVQATDGGTPSLFSQLDITIQLVDINDNPPVFVNPVSTVDVSESTGVGERIITVTATDADIGENAEILYSINGSTLFYINVSTSEIFLNSTLDYETDIEHMVVVVAADRPGLFSTPHSIQIRVIDENDNSPVFLADPYTVTVPENSPTGTFVVNVSATDADSGMLGEVHYSIVGGNDVNLFSIATISGTITVNGDIDREIVSAVSLTVQAADLGNPPRSTNTTVLINVSDINDNTPVFSSLRYEMNISEDTPVSIVVVTVDAIDFDANNQITYSLERSDNNPFSIEQNGSIILTSALDFETQEVHSFVALAVDDGDPSLTGTAEIVITVINVNDLPPMLTGDGMVSIPESTSVGSRIARFTATGEEGETLTFSLNVSSPFIIDNETGVVTVNETLDFEMTMFYNVLVTVSDGLFNASSTLLIIVVDVNDNAPQIMGGLQFAVEEETPVNTSVGRVMISDADSGVNAQLTCTLSQPQNREFFVIDSNCREIFTATRIDRESIDTFNPQPNATITAMLQVTDNGNPALSTASNVEFLIIGINDNAPVFVNPTGNTDLEESTPVGEMVAQISATDADVGNDPILYTITGFSTRSKNSMGVITDSTGIGESSVFAINSSTGVITLISSLDYEAAIEHTVFITAANPDGLKSTDNASHTVTVINENDNFPMFTENRYNAVVSEGSHNGTFVLTVLANDDDLGMPGEVRYSLASGNVGDAFTINATSGVITVNGGIDREETSVFELTVVATDLGIPSKSSQSLAVINVEDINDNSPVFDPSTYTVRVFENVSVNYLLITVSATDADIPPNSNIMYSVITGNNLFNISQNGSLFTASLLDFETAPSHEIVVQATNNETVPMLSSSAMITVLVLDVNDEQPIPVGNTNVTVSEQAPVNSMISLFTVQNLEVGDEISFELSGNMSEVFVINASTGLITLAQSLDYELTQSYDLLLTVNDGIFTTVIGLQVNVQDENDNSPIFEEFGPFVLTEELPINSTVGTVVASDEDSGENSRLTYTISRNVANLFAIDSTTGDILTAMVLDREVLVGMNLFTPPTFSQNITVQVEDNGSPSLVSEVMVSIRLVDINDNAPVFDIFEQNLTYPENIQNNTVIVEVLATDLDQDENGTVTYSIASDEPLPFAIDSSTGVVTTIDTLDRESVDYYMFDIVASDNGVDIVQSSSIEITVDVTDINDNPPIFENTPYEIEIPEDVATDGGTSFSPLTIRTSDRDIGVNAQVRFSLAPGTPSEFDIQTSGEFRITASIINFEGQNEFNITVIATDRGLPALTSSTVVNIEIVNIDEFAPDFDGPCDVTISEDTLVDTVVTQCLATDADGGQVFYQTFSISISNVFDVDFDTGEVTLLQPLDREMVDQYQFTLQAGSLFARNATLNPLAEMLVTITVEDVNDNPPVFNPNIYQVSLTENEVSMGVVLLTLEVTDDDINENGQFSLNIINSCTLPPTDGSTVTDIINVTAVDMGTPALTGLATIVLSRSCASECALDIDGRTIRFYAFCESDLVSETFIFGTPAQLDCGPITNVPVTYQWQFNGTLITNISSNPLLDLGEADFDDVGSYSCIARTSLGNYQTNTANIKVYSMPAIERPPEDAAVEIGRVVQMTCFVSGVPKPEIKFYHNNADVVLNDRVSQIDSPIGSVIVITNVITADQGIYYCEATNVVNTTRSSSAVLIVFSISELVTVTLRISNPNEDGTCHNLNIDMIENVLASSTGHGVDVNRTEAVDGGFCEPNSCYPNPCQNNGRCSVNENATEGYICDCPDTFTGVNCQDDLDECVSDDPCLFESNCTNIPGLFECACPSGREGHRCQYEIKCNNNSLCAGGETCVETVANALGYVCISTPVEERLRIQLSEDVTINQVNEALYGLTNRLLELDPNSTDFCEPRFISVDGIDTITLVWGCPNGTDPLGIIAEDLICEDFLNAFLVTMCTLSDGTIQQPPEINLEPISVLVTFVLIDPETNQTLSATEAITILQQGNAQAALFSDNVQAISAFAVAGPTDDNDNDNNNDNNDGGLSGGATAGVVIAVLLVLIVLTLLGIYVGYKYYGNRTKYSANQNKTLPTLQDDVEDGINQRTHTVAGMFNNQAFGRQQTRPSVGADTVFENPTFTDAPVITKLEGNTEPIKKSAITRITSEESKPSVTSETGLLS